MLHVNDDNEDFEYKHILPYKDYSQNILSMNRGYKLAILNPDVETIADVQLYENQLKFVESQQVLSIDFS